MRVAVLILFFAMIPLTAAEPSEEKEIVATVQKLFDAMAAHDSDAARAVILPEGKTISVRDTGAVSMGTQEQFAARLSSIKEPILERMWNPKVLVQGRIAQVWAEYDFWRSGKFGHCGVDSVSLVKATDGWKIATISWTTQTTDCAPSPLGPPSGAQK